MERQKNSAVGIAASGNVPQSSSLLMMPFALLHSQLPGKKSVDISGIPFCGPAHGDARSLDKY